MFEVEPNWDSDFVYRNEFQVAFDQSRAETSLTDDRPLAKELTLAGKFVVMGQFDVFCRMTDAIIGTDYAILQVFDDEESAKDLVDQSQDDIWLFTVAESLPQVVVEESEEAPF